jgi:hypothetical protein
MTDGEQLFLIIVLVLIGAGFIAQQRQIGRLRRQMFVMTRAQAELVSIAGRTVGILEKDKRAAEILSRLPAAGGRQ